MYNECEARSTPYAKCSRRSEEIGHASRRITGAYYSYANIVHYGAFARRLAAFLGDKWHVNDTQKGKLREICPSRWFHKRA